MCCPHGYSCITSSCICSFLSLCNHVLKEFSNAIATRFKNLSYIIALMCNVSPCVFIYNECLRVYYMLGLI